MEYSGLIQKYKINRPLTQEEKQLQLKQKKKIHANPDYLFATIKVNGTYLELADKYYGERGWLTMGMGLVSCVCSWAIAMFGFGSLAAIMNPDSLANKMEIHIVVAFAMLVLSFLLAFAIWGLRKEAFFLTHFPARLNRKTRMVHVFRPDRSGSILSVPWNDVFFTIGRGQTLQYRDIRGHVLDKDGVTVLETFTLGTSWVDCEALTNHWEYMRRYMEEGPQAIVERTLLYLPIADKKETWAFALRRLYLLMPTYVAMTLYTPFYLFLLPFRMFANATSKIPQWSADIEAQCTIEPNDPYVRDESFNKYNRWGWPI